MSQWGAYALAVRGKDYGSILRYYYRGAELAPYARP
jgi:stage II sporulation protein D